MPTASACRRNSIYLVLVATGVAVVIYLMRQVQYRLARERLRAMAQATTALLRYVQLQHHSSEEEAYQRIAAFVKKHVEPGEQTIIGSLLAQDRQRLLALARGLLRYFPQEIDEI